jgi:Plasmid pRiA4b ORF-3-like protein
MAGKAAPSEIYQLKVTLQDSKPPIWRRVQVPADIKLSHLHNVLQLVMGWDNAHLHQFIIDGTYYGMTGPDLDMMDMEVEDERKVKLNAVVGPKGKFVYEYDFGDSWEHRIVVEKALPPEAGTKYPLCTAGARNGPPEDCGGIWGYADLLAALKDPKHPEHDDMEEWIGGEFDPEAFDLEEINSRLGHLAR